MLTEKSFVVLGVNHRVQGDPTHPGTLEDPDYLDLLAKTISCHSIDFVGEECKSNPTHAKRIAQEMLGDGHYENVDPLVGSEREQLGIGTTGGMLPLVNASGGGYSINFQIVSEQEKREAIWVERLAEKTAVNGLLICGHLHALSVAFRLQNRGFQVKVRIYLPLAKLCGHEGRT